MSIFSVKSIQQTLHVIAYVEYLIRMRV